jgi:hypothetical protein
MQATLFIRLHAHATHLARTGLTVIKPPLFQTGQIYIGIECLLSLFKTKN